jgi:hypothetical protein
MFTQNKYTKWYFNIINSAKTREIINEVYYENHHIIPKALGGDNSKENLVKLTAREHFICHLLLVKMVKTKAHRRSMSFALITMKRSNGGGRKASINSKQFELARKIASENISGKNNPFYGKTDVFRGEKNPMYGKPCYYKMTEDEKETWKKNISSSTLGEKNHFYGKNHTKETRKIISEHRSIPIKVEFFDGKIEIFDQFGDLGEYLGKSRSLGSKLCKPKYEYLLKNYNIKSITRLK